MTRVNRSSLTLLAALILGWIWDLFFYDKALGLSIPLYVLLLTAALFGLGRLEGLAPKRRNLWLLVPLFFFATMVFVRASPFLTFLNVAASLTLLGLVCNFYAAGAVERLGLLGYPFVLIQMGLKALFLPAPLLSASVNFKVVRERGKRNLLPVVRGCLLALPVLAIFSCFLASADLVFADYFKNLFSLDFLTELPHWTGRGIVILGVAWVIAGGLVYALTRRQKLDDEGALEKALGSLSRTIPLGFIEAVVLLTSVNLLFLVFVWIQFTYLFGGQANITLQGYTYAEYARSGFFELLAVSVMTLGLVLTLHQWGRRETRRQGQTFNGLSSLMVALVLVILASAFQRLLLYEDAFGYTELRLYGYVFMVWLAVTFVWFLIVLWFRPNRFAIGAFLAALGFLVTLNLINPDVFIAEWNLARYQSTGKLDIEYLTTLSEDVVPVLIQSRDQLEDNDRQRLDGHLRRRLEQMEENDRWRGWPAFHLSRQRAYDMLVESQSD